MSISNSLIYAVIITFLSLCNYSCDSKTSFETSEIKVNRKPSLEKAHIVSYQNLSNEEFIGKTSSNPKAIIIDVRRPKEVAKGKIEGALEINWHDKDFADQIFALDRQNEYYLYCRIGGRSAKAARLMIKNGFNHVFNLEEGYQSWEIQDSIKK